MTRRFLVVCLLIIIIGIIIFSYFSSDLSTNKPTNQKQLDTVSDYNVFFCPEDDCNLILYNYISNAETIDCAIYNITLDWFYPLVQHKKTRIITDNENYNLDYNFVKTDNSNSYMHNKFCIFDKNILLIGSTNFTKDGLEKQNNNFVITNNKKLVNKFQLYFDKLYNNEFNYGKSGKDFCFSPGNCINHYIALVKNAKTNIKCMFFCFTYDDLANELIRNKEKGVDVKIILEKSQDSQYSEYAKLKEAGIKIIWDKNPSYMHNKFCIFDSNLVVTGSMNPTNRGNFNNNESIVIIEDKNLAKKYTQYFDKYYTRWE